MVFKPFIVLLRLFVLLGLANALRGFESVGTGVDSKLEPVTTQYSTLSRTVYVPGYVAPTPLSNGQLHNLASSGLSTISPSKVEADTTVTSSLIVTTSVSKTLTVTYVVNEIHVSNTADHDSGAFNTDAGLSSMEKPYTTHYSTLTVNSMVTPTPTSKSNHVVPPRVEKFPGAQSYQGDEQINLRDNGDAPVGNVTGVAHNVHDSLTPASPQTELKKRSEVIRAMVQDPSLRHDLTSSASTTLRPAAIFSKITSVFSISKVASFFRFTTISSSSNQVKKRVELIRPVVMAPIATSTSARLRVPWVFGVLTSVARGVDARARSEGTRALAILPVSRGMTFYKQLAAQLQELNMQEICLRYKLVQCIRDYLALVGGRSSLALEGEVAAHSGGN